MNILMLLRKAKYVVGWIYTAFPLRSEFGACAKNVQLNYPVRVTTPKTVFIQENCRIQHDVSIINSATEKVVIKKYSVITAHNTIVPGNHISTVSIPQFLLGASHINDKSTDIIVEEDCWVGTGSILLAGTHLGRGCIIGAGTVVNKDIPPYSLAVGCPAKIIAVKFSIEQILEHEKTLYPENERFSREYLEGLFKTYYEGKRIFGLSSGLDEDAERLLECVKKNLKYVNPF